jgi:hypothetical protein
MKRILKFEDWIDRVQNRLQLFELETKRTKAHVP